MKMDQVAITATDNQPKRVSSKFAASARVKNVLTALALAAGLTFHISAHATEYELGIVTQNAFVVSKKPKVKRGRKLTYGLVGYLPIGTRVFFRDIPEKINNLKKGQPETYYPVSSSIGIEGLLREDLFVPVNEKHIAVVIGRDPITLHNPDPSKGKFKKLLTMGRYDNAYLEITDETSSHYLAFLKRRNKATNLPEIESVRLWKEYVDSGSVILIKPHQSLRIPKWAEQEKLDNDSVKEIIEKIKDKLGDKLKQAKSILIDANTIQCLLKASSEAELGFKVFGSGLSFKLGMAFKDQDQMFRLMRRKLDKGSKKETTYLILQNVKCDGGIPERLQRLTLQEGLYNPKKRASVRLKDLTIQPSKWITSLQGRNAPFRMVRINSEQNYMQVLRQLDEFVNKGDSFISKLSPEQQDILLNLLLREISYFESPPKLTPINSKSLTN